MVKKLSILPAAATPPEPEPIVQRHTRFIVGVGSQRLAFDFYTKVTELNPTAATMQAIQSEARVLNRRD